MNFKIIRDTFSFSRKLKKHSKFSLKFVAKYVAEKSATSLNLNKRKLLKANIQTWCANSKHTCRLPFYLYLKKTSTSYQKGKKKRKKKGRALSQTKQADHWYLSHAREKENVGTGKVPIYIYIYIFFFFFGKRSQYLRDDILNSRMSITIVYLI